MTRARPDSTVMGSTCPTCNAPFADVPDDMSMELNTPSRVCLCDAVRVHQALTEAGLLPLDMGSRQSAHPPVDDDVLREGGWPVTPALSYERGDHDARWTADEDLPPWARVELAYAWTRLYADAWAVTVTRFLFDGSGERIRARCVQVLQRGAADPDFRAATMAVHRVGDNAAFRAALLMRPPK